MADVQIVQPRRTLPRYRRGVHAAAPGPDGKLDTVADLTGLGGTPFNELVVDTARNACVNVRPGIVRVQPGGMALTDDDRTLVADSSAEQLIAYEVADDETLASLRTAVRGKGERGCRRRW